jgi:hypothetical protein
MNVKATKLSFKGDLLKKKSKKRKNYDDIEQVIEARFSGLDDAGILITLIYR